MAGRPRKPSAVREAEGNPGHRAIRVEPTFTGTPKCPTWLSTEAKKEWKRITGVLADLDLLRAVDTAVLASYCVAFARWQQAEQQVATEGTVLRITGSTGQEKIVKHPALLVSDQSQKQMFRACSLLGFSPADRTRVAVNAKEAANPFDDLDD